jgi:hypothetical protein
MHRFLECGVPGVGDWQPVVCAAKDKVPSRSILLADSNPPSRADDAHHMKNVSASVTRPVTFIDLTVEDHG